MSYLHMPMSQVRCIHNLIVPICLRLYAFTPCNHVTLSLTSVFHLEDLLPLWMLAFRNIHRYLKPRERQPIFVSLG